MTSNLKFKSNRRNAKKSTGPKTNAGKMKSAVNAISHGLSAQPVFDKETQEKIENLATSFTNGETNNPQVVTLAREAAEAQVMVERVKDARRLVWAEACRDRSIGTLTIFNDRSMEPHIHNNIGMPVGDLKQIMPFALIAAFESDIEREAAILKVVSGKLSKLIRFERRTANQRDKALRLLAHIEKIENEL